MLEDIQGLFSVTGLLTLAMLVMLQAVLGFDNLLYISLESKRVDAKDQTRVRRWGIGLAIGLRIVLLFVVTHVIELFEDPLLTLGNESKETLWFGSFNLESLVVLCGGGFIMYTAIKEIYHMLSIDELEPTQRGNQRSVMGAIFWIVVMNMVFSFDSILSAMALTSNFAIMAAAIVISGLLMMVLADHVSAFLQRNRMYEVLGLFILFIVGIMLVSEGGHKAHITLMGYHVEAMQKSTFYFVLFVLVIVDIVQGRYQRKLMAQRRLEQETAASQSTSV